MDSFRALVALVLVSGTVAGLMLFGIQHFTVIPLIEKAETYERAADQAMPGMSHQDEGWQPEEGTERTLFTALTTVMSAIGFAAVLFGILSLGPAVLDWKRGAVWGLGAFVCINLAPAFGLPPQPPGVAVADLYSRQIWWVATAASTAIGLRLLLDSRRTWFKAPMGIIAIVLPHVIGAPVATGDNSVPAQLAHQFAVLSVTTTGLFWIALGSLGGFLQARLAPGHSPSRREQILQQDRFR